jgi:hypothetical protein
LASKHLGAKLAQRHENVTKLGIDDESAAGHPRW